MLTSCNVFLFPKLKSKIQGTHFQSTEDIHKKMAEQLTVKGTVKAIPLQAWTGPEGSRKLRLPGWWQVVSLTHRPPLPPGNTPGTHFC